MIGVSPKNLGRGKEWKDRSNASWRKRIQTRSRDSSASVRATPFSESFGPMPRTRLHSIHHSMLPPLWMLSTPSDMNVINYHQIGADVDWYIERSCSFTVDLRSHLWVMTMGTGRGEKGRLPVCGVVSSSSSSLSMRVDRPCGEKRRRIGAIPRRIVLLVGKGRTGFFLIFIFVISHRTVSEEK